MKTEFLTIKPGGNHQEQIQEKVFTAFRKYPSMSCMLISRCKMMSIPLLAQLPKSVAKKYCFNSFLQSWEYHTWIFALNISKNYNSLFFPLLIYDCREAPCLTPILIEIFNGNLPVPKGCLAKPVSQKRKNMPFQISNMFKRKTLK